jgi:hypothetical protein
MTISSSSEGRKGGKERCAHEKDALREPDFEFTSLCRRAVAVPITPRMSTTLVPQEPDPGVLRVQILGAAILLSWNTEIVAGSYFGERLKDSPFERSFANFVASPQDPAIQVLLQASTASAGVRTRGHARALAHLGLGSISTQFASINPT